MVNPPAGDRAEQARDDEPPKRGAEVRALGRHLEQHAAEVGAAVLERCQRFVDTYPPDTRTRIARDVVRTCTLATATIGHYMATGDSATPDEWRSIAAVGSAPAREAISLGDMTKLYLRWRDTTLDAAKVFLATTEGGAAVLADVEHIVTAGCDASLVRTARRFDERRRELQAQLADERARLAYLARHDALTGLPNRHSLFEHLGQVVEHCHDTGEGAAVLFVDLDRFKAINDSVGHAGGDQLLCAVAGRIRGAVSSEDVVARLGGDEFVVLCAGLDAPAEQAGGIAERIEEALRAPFTIGGVMQTASASIGVTIVGPGDDPERLISQADTAMYKAKQSGRACHEMYEVAVAVQQA